MIEWLYVAPVLLAPLIALLGVRIARRIHSDKS